MHIEKLVGGWAVPSERQSNPERSDDAVSVWRVSGNNGIRLRFCCRMGMVTVWEEPGDRLLLSVNLGRLAEIRRRAFLRRERARRGLATIRELSREEELACWAAAAADPETRFFETLKGGPERFGGRGRLMHALAMLLESRGQPVPWCAEDTLA
jgi:hypothetical protein